MTRPSTIYASLWSIALPAMLTNVATALFGLADMWVIGRLGDAAAQGAILNDKVGAEAGGGN